MSMTPKKNTGSTFITTDDNFNIDLETIPQQINSSCRYRKLYNRLYASTKRAYKFRQEDESKKQIQTLRQTISNRLNMKAENQQFHRKFGLKTESNKMNLSRKYQNLFGLTQLDKNQEDLDQFMMNHTKTKELQQLSRLTEFYLRDLDKVKTNTMYLNRIKDQSKHQRISPFAKNRNTIFMTDINHYEKLKKISDLKHNQLLRKAIVVAKQNTSFRRIDNFRRIRYVIYTDNKNVIAATEVETMADIEQYRSNLRKIFLHFAKHSEAQRIYYEYIEKKMFPELHQFLASSTQSGPVEKDIKQTITQIIKYKYKKMLHFEDFRELIETLSSKYPDYNLLENILEKKPCILKNKVEDFQFEHHEEIQKILANLNIPVTIQKFYKKHKNSIIACHNLPFETLLIIMKENRIIPNIISNTQFVYTCERNKRKLEGFDMNQFLKIQVHLALTLNCSLEGIKDYFSSLRPETLP